MLPKPEEVARSSRVWPAIAALALVAAIGAVAALWPRTPGVLPLADLKPVRRRPIHRITRSPAAALSPDGRFIAYSDPRGIHVLVMATKETESIPGTEGLVATGWSNDGTKVTGFRVASGLAPSYWSISIVGAGTRRPIAPGAPPAPDGKQTLMAEDGHLWIEGPPGRRQLRSASTSGDPREALQLLVWTPDSRRVVAIRPARILGQNELVAIDTESDPSDVLATTEQMPRFVRAMVAAGDNRVIVSAPEVPANDFVLPETDANLWEIRIDQVGPVRRLTNWTGFPIPSSASRPMADGWCSFRRNTRKMSGSAGSRRTSHAL